MSNKKQVLLWDKFVDLVSNPRTVLTRDKKKVLLALFLLAWAAGLYYPVAKILRFEFPWVPPATVRFNVGIYDPYDPFRGRYVAISVQREQVRVARNVDGSHAVDSNKRLYAVIEPDEKGMAEIVNLAEKSEAGKINLLLERDSVYLATRNVADAGYDIYNVQLPFTRFYMNEKLAPEAEHAFAQAVRGGGPGTCQIVVKIYSDGRYAIDSLEIKGMPIHEFLKKERASREGTGHIIESSEKGTERVMLAEEDIDIDEREADIAELSAKDDGSNIIVFVPD